MSTSTLTPEAQAQLAKLATDLANNPKTRKQFVGLVKEIDPSKRFPDVENDELREEFKRELADRDRKAEADRIKQHQENQRNALKERYDDATIAEIEKMMEKKGIGDYEDGAALYSAITKPEKPSYEPQDHAWSLPNIEIKDFDKLKQRSRASAYQAIDDLNRKRK